MSIRSEKKTVEELKGGTITTTTTEIRTDEDLANEMKGFLTQQFGAEPKQKHKKRMPKTKSAPGFKTQKVDRESRKKLPSSKTESSLGKRKKKKKREPSRSRKDKRDKKKGDREKKKQKQGDKKKKKQKQGENVDWDRIASPRHARRTLTDQNVLYEKQEEEEIEDLESRENVEDLHDHHHEVMQSQVEEMPDFTYTLLDYDFTVDNAFLRIPCCDSIPYLKDPLHDEIIHGHYHLKAMFLDSMKTHFERTMDVLNQDEIDIRAKMKSLQDELDALLAQLADLKAQLQELDKESEALEDAMEEFNKIQGELSALDEKAYAFMKAMRRPPEAFHHIIAGVMLILGHATKKGTEWPACKKFLLDHESRSDMLTLKVRDIKYRDIQKFAKYMSEHKDSFTFERAARVSGVAALLLKWLLSLWNVCQELKELLEIQSKSNDNMAEVDELRKNIQDLIDRIAEIRHLLKNWELVLQTVLGNQKQVSACLENTNNHGIKIHRRELSVKNTEQ